jgi:hypothetical protein
MAIVGRQTWIPPAGNDGYEKGPARLERGVARKERTRLWWTRSWLRGWHCGEWGEVCAFWAGAFGRGVREGRVEAGRIFTPHVRPTWGRVARLSSGLCGNGRGSCTRAGWRRGREAHGWRRRGREGWDGEERREVKDVAYEWRSWRVTLDDQESRTLTLMKNSIPIFGTRGL